MRRKEKEITERSLIEDIIRRSDVCRIAMANGNTPYIVTMNFGHSGGYPGRLYFHCAPEGRKLDMIRNNSYVCFEMDTDHRLTKGTTGCDWGMEYKSLVGYGHIMIATDRTEKIRGLECIMNHYGGEGNYEFGESMVDRTAVLILEITEITGKKC